MNEQSLSRVSVTSGTTIAQWRYLDSRAGGFHFNSMLSRHRSLDSLGIATLRCFGILGIALL